MLVFKTAGITLMFDEERASIHSLRDVDREYVGEEIPVFRISFRDEAGEQIYVEKDALLLREYKKEESSFEAVYTDGERVVTVLADIADKIEWRIRIDAGKEEVVEWVDFPQLAVPNDLKGRGGSCEILWGFNEGGIVDDLEYKQRGAFKYCELQYPSIPCIPMYPGIVESQLVAYFGERTGLYFAAHDREDHIKGIDFYPYNDAIMFQMRHYSGCDYGETYRMKFPMVMMFFRGEWQDAAQIYKDWFKENKADAFTPIAENEALPDWYSASPVVVTYPVRGLHDADVMNPNKLFPYINAMKHIERLEQELNSKILVILMHWEGTAPWAPPYVWPPYGGEEELKKFIDALHERGDVLGVYCSGLGWTQYSKLVDDYSREAEYAEKNLQKVMCRSPKQELPPSLVVDFTRHGYDMCPTQQFTVDVLCDQVKKMVAADIDYIQLLDQQHGGTSYFCYSKDHGHPPIPGKWQVEAMNQLLSEVEKVSGDVLLGTESAAAESYIPHLLFSDNRYQLNYGTGKPVPLYAYLYHEYVNNFMGNQVSANGFLDHERSPINILARLAYSFIAGDMLALVLNENGDISWNWGWRKADIPDQKSIKELVRNTNQWRRGRGKKYLHTGSMVKPYKVICEQNSIYSRKGYEIKIEKIYTSAWVSQEGTYGQFLVNYNCEDVECEIQLPEVSYRLYEDEGSYEKISGGCQKINVKKLSVMLIEKTDEK